MEKEELQNKAQTPEEVQAPKAEEAQAPKAEEVQDESNEQDDELEESNEREEEKKDGITGWLAFFLWVGVGLGAIISCVTTITSLSGVGWTPFSVALFGTYLGSMVAVAVMTIVAFYKRSENAVALATTYVVMIAADAVLQFIVSVMIEEDPITKDVVRSFVWAIVWFCYLRMSKQVKRVIPEEKRSWKLAEKILLGVYLAACVAYVSSMHTMVTDPTNNLLVSKEYLIRQAVEEANKELPTMTNGLLFKSVTIEGKRIVYNYHYPNNTIDELNMDYLDKFGIANKQAMIKNYATETDEDVVKLNKLFFDGGYDVCYYYKDKYGEIALPVITTAEDFARGRAMGADFRCDTTAWNELLGKVNRDLPAEYMGDCMLQQVSVDYEANKVHYEVTLPELTSLMLKVFVTEEYLQGYVQENIEALCDYVWYMGALDKMDIEYQFNSTDGKPHATVTVPYADYKEHV